MTRTGLLCQKERGLKKQRESKRSWASDEGGKLRVRVGVRRGDIGSAIATQDNKARTLS